MSESPTNRDPYRLQPVADTHREESSRLILQAAELVSPRSAIVLGAGSCEEIPLASLCDRFERVVLNDLDSSLVENALEAASLTSEQRAKVELSTADITGQTELIAAVIRDNVAAAANVEDAIDRMSQVVELAPQVASPIGGEFDLVVASCVLCQLHVAATQRAREVFVARFKELESVLLGSPRWQQAVYQLARKMETTFIDRLLGWTAPGGRIFLSETVQMCRIELTESGDWLSAGSYRLTKSLNLLDYLDDRFHIETKHRWDWIVNPPQKPGEQGRLFDVQGAILAIP